MWSGLLELRLHVSPDARDRDLPGGTTDRRREQDSELAPTAALRERLRAPGRQRADELSAVPPGHGGRARSALYRGIAGLLHQREFPGECSVLARLYHPRRAKEPLGRSW